MRLRIAMSLVAGAAACMALAACSTLRAIEPVLAPPPQFQLNRTVTVEFVAGAAVSERCAERGASHSGACGSRDLITLPDPCEARGDGYARGLCESVGETSRVTIVFVHPDLAPAPCGLARASVVVCAGDRVVAVNPCLYQERGRYAELACHELAHANGWAAGHPGGSYGARASFIKARLAPEDILPPEAVRVALLAKAGAKAPDDVSGRFQEAGR